MADLKERILAVISKPQMSSFATVTEDGKPWVRYVMTLGADDLSLRFSTFVNARKVKQISRDPEVHLTMGVSDPEDWNSYVQVQGKAELTTDQKEKDALWNDQLSMIFKGPDDPDYGIIIVRPYRIELNTMGKMKPEVWES